MVFLSKDPNLSINVIFFLLYFKKNQKLVSGRVAKILAFCEFSQRNDVFEWNLRGFGSLWNHQIGAINQQTVQEINKVHCWITFTSDYNIK